MTTYVIWLISEDTEFRAAYLSIVGEAIQSMPMVNEADTQYCIGSSRITASNIEELELLFPNMETSDTIPPEFIY